MLVFCHWHYQNSDTAGKTKLKRINCKNKHHVQYPDIPSAMKLVPHGSDLTVSEPDVTMESIFDPESGDINDTAHLVHTSQSRAKGQSR